MSIMMVITLIGGLGLFIYGMHMMSEGLRIVAGNRMKRLLEVLTNNTFKAILVGIVVTMIVQSSSTTTVMVVGFVNASLMSLFQAAGVILGANIGTTITAQLIAFNISAIAPVFIGIGTIMYLFAGRKKTRDVGSIVLGFGILFFGISTMSGSMSSLKDSETFIYLLSTYGKNPFFGLLIGTAITAVMQSSSATVGLLQALALSGVFASVSGVDSTEAIRICIPIMIGTNIGTCVTAILSSIGTSATAKKAALFHLFVNIFGAVWVMILLLGIDAVTANNPIYEFIVSISGSITENGETMPNIARQIAMGHTLFNVANMLVMLPIMKPAVNLLDKLIKSEEEEEDGLQLDPRFLNNPAIALGQVSKEVQKVGTMARKNFTQSCKMVFNADEKVIKKVHDREIRIDSFETGIMDYVVQLSNLNMSTRENERIAFYLKGIHDLERIGDHAENIVEIAEMKANDNIQLSEEAADDINQLVRLTTDILDNTIVVFSTEEEALCLKIMDQEEQVDRLTEEFQNNHIERLNKGICNPVAGVIFFDILSNIERISDHASNIARGILDLEMKTEQADRIEEVVF